MWPGIRTWIRSASNYPCLRREENPGGRTGYPENHWNSFFVSPKCGKRMGYVFVLKLLACMAHMATPIYCKID
jgi:hypothetical protein